MIPGSSATAELQHVLSTAPNSFRGNVHNQSEVAHASLQALRDSGDERFLFFRTILEIIASHFHNQHQDAAAAAAAIKGQEELIFHCVTGCRHVILSRWRTSSSRFRSVSRDFFMVLGHQMFLTRTIRLACYNSSASFWKRQWNENKEEQNSKSQTLSHEEQSIVDLIMAQQHMQVPLLTRKQDLFAYLEGITTPQEQPSSSPTSLMESGAYYLATLVGEFAGKSSSNYRMALEFHKQAHSSFETDGWLDRSLQISMKALSYVVSIMNSVDKSNVTEDLAVSVIQVTIDVIGWEFGTDAWEAGFPHSSGKTLVRPPVAWRDVLMQPDFVKAVFHVHGIVAGSANPDSKLGHCLRQLLLLLASMSGPMFRDANERKVYCTYLLEGTLQLLSTALASASRLAETSELLDTLAMVSRLIANFRLSVLVDLPLFQSLLQGITSVGRQLLHDNTAECQAAGGDFESMEHREWREEALVLLLEGAVFLCEDPWLLYSGSEQSRTAAQRALAQTLAPLYADFVACRTRMARLEEHYLTAHETELDEVREEIFSVDLEEEMASLASIGRLDVSSSLACLAALFQSLEPQLQALWDGGNNNGVVTPDAAGLLEESRLVTVYIGHLLTDDNAGETPVIPDSIIIGCQHGDKLSNEISSAVQKLLHFAQAQASKIASQPSDPRLSPLLAKSFVWFLNRWAPAYILPVGYGSSTVSPSTILKVWSSRDAIEQAVSFCITLCLHYQSYWPHERQVQESAALLLLSLAKRCKEMRNAMVASSSFRQLVNVFCLTAGIRHSASPTEVEATVRSKAGNVPNPPSLELVRGYQRLPYSIRSRILTAILVACSELHDEQAKALLNECFQAIHEAFSGLVHVLATKQRSAEHVDAKEMACLCVELYGGVARAGDMVAADRIPKFLSPSLPHLSGLMTYYAEDLSVCELLLRLFCDYSEQFIAVLEPDACLVLFRSSAELLKAYSAHHCSVATRRVVRAGVAKTNSVATPEEEQNYSDVLCAIQLLIQLGTKDFIDIGEGGVDTTQVTDMIFFGLQQILPLMTQGLLQFPILCSHYFSLVGFMMETYPEKLAALPYELFDALLESLLFGMSHHDPAVAKSSLQGLAGLLREHLSSKALMQHVESSRSSSSGGLFEKCVRRLLRDVVFQNIIWDRLEAAGMALLPLAAVDLELFASVVKELMTQTALPVEHQQRLSLAFEGLLRPEVLAKVTSRGYEGRQNRIRFKRDLETFCHEIHSFLVIK